MIFSLYIIILISGDTTKAVFIIPCFLVNGNGVGHIHVWYKNYYVNEGKVNDFNHLLKDHLIV